MSCKKVQIKTSAVGIPKEETHRLLKNMNMAGNIKVTKRSIRPGTIKMLER